MAEQSLKDKTVKGAAWSGFDNVAQYMAGFIVSIVLARLLSPGDYGLLGLTAVFTAVCTTLINGGFSSALIRKKDATEDDFNTVFIVNLTMSIFLYMLIFLCSPLIADFFGRKELISLTRVASVDMIIGALALVQQTRLTKRIDFKSQTKITLIAVVTGGIVGIAMAFIGFGVWALIAQHLSSRCIRTVLLWRVNKWIPKLKFSKKSFNDLFGFGWKMAVSGILDTVWKELYQVVVGKYYSPATLGQYSRAKHFSQIFSSNLTYVVERVTYPVLSSIQDEHARLISAYRRIIKTTMFITAICMFFLGAVSEPLLFCLIGPKWNDAAAYLPLICINGTLYPLHSLNLNMLKVQGRSDLFLGLEIVKKIIGLPPLFVCYFYGVMPMLYVALVTGVIAYFLNSYFPGKILGYTSWMQIKDIAPSFLVATIISIPVYLLKFMPLSYWFILPLQIILGIFFFLVVNKFLKMEEMQEIKSAVSPFIKKFKS